MHFDLPPLEPLPPKEIRYIAQQIHTAVPLKIIRDKEEQPYDSSSILYKSEPEKPPYPLPQSFLDGAKLPVKMREIKYIRLPKGWHCTMIHSFRPTSRLIWFSPKSGDGSLIFFCYGDNNNKEGADQFQKTLAIKPHTLTTEEAKLIASNIPDSPVTHSWPTSPLSAHTTYLNDRLVIEADGVRNRNGSPRPFHSITYAIQNSFREMRQMQIEFAGSPETFKKYQQEIAGCFKSIQWRPDLKPIVGTVDGAKLPIPMPEIKSLSLPKNWLDDCTSYSTAYYMFHRPDDKSLSGIIQLTNIDGPFDPDEQNKFQKIMKGNYHELTQEEIRSVADLGFYLEKWAPGWTTARTKNWNGRTVIEGEGATVDGDHNKRQFYGIIYTVDKRKDKTKIVLMQFIGDPIHFKSDYAQAKRCMKSIQWRYIY